MRSNTVRTNRWHAVRVSIERNEGAYDIRINSMPEHDHMSAWLTPKKARELAAVLMKAAKEVERKS